MTDQPSKNDDSDSDTDLESQEASLLFRRVDSMLHRYRREYPSLVHDEASSNSTPPSTFLTEQPTTENISTTTDQDNIPILTEQVTLKLDAWPAQTELPELLYLAFDAALKEVHIRLTPAERLMLIQALVKRLPKNL